MLLWLGEPVAFVLSPSAEKLYPLKSFVWDLDPSHHDVMKSLAQGIFAIDRARHKPNSIDRAVANRPILLESASANRLLEIRPASLARQREVAQAVIEEFTANHPAERMTRADFIAAVRQQLPRLARDAIIRTWRDLAPADWRRPGPKHRV